MTKNVNTALLVMDMQSVITERLANSDTLIKKVNDTIRIARNQHIPVLFIRVGFRAGAPEISPNNKSFFKFKESTQWTEKFAENWLALHADLDFQPQDILITKKRISAFTGSDLEVILKGLEIKHLILTGISTSGVVLSTLREAADKDFEITVISDCCADINEEVHQVLLNKIFPAQAEVLTLQQWLASFE